MYIKPWWERLWCKITGKEYWTNPFAGCYEKHNTKWTPPSNESINSLKAFMKKSDEGIIENILLQIVDGIIK